PPRARTAPRVRAMVAALVTAWLVVAALCSPLAAQAQTTPAFTNLQVTRDAQGLFASFGVRFDLPRAVEDALGKGVPLYFVVEATLYSERWYWTDRRAARTSRVWRLAYQPLTRKYRVTIGGENHSFDTLAEALAMV